MEHRSRRPLAAVAVAAIVAALTPPAGHAQGDRPRVTPEAVPALRAQLEQERQLLAEDRETYAAVRAGERERWRRVEELKAALDGDLAADLPQVTDLRAKEAALDAAVAAAESSSARAAELRQQILERLRRSALLEADLARVAAVAIDVPDPISGRWEVLIEPDEMRGVFDLVLDATLIRGRFRLDDGHIGSLRGSFTGRTIHLERVDRQRGLDALFDGTYDAEEQRLSGFWVPVDVSGGAPGGGDWAATKQTEEESRP